MKPDVASSVGLFPNRSGIATSSGYPSVVFITDFGTRDPYVGIMKGVLLTRAPQVRIVDLTHDIPPQDAAAAAFCLRVSTPFFPKGSLFVVVVDPGVGSARKILWARSRDHQFLAPDNGVLGGIKDPILECRIVSNRSLMRDKISSTFQGRDIFAPVAAAIARGVPSKSLGPLTRRWSSLLFPRPILKKSGVVGEIVHIDHFGNAISNLKREDVLGFKQAFVKGEKIGPLRDHYAEVVVGKPLALIGSFGFLELAVAGGSFARRFEIKRGEKIECR